MSSDAILDPNIGYLVPLRIGGTPDCDRRTEYFFENEIGLKAEHGNILRRRPSA